MATLSESKFMVKVKVIGKTSKRGNSFVTPVIDNNSKTIKNVYSKKDRLTDGKFYLLRNISVGESISMTENCMVMECSSFEFNEDLEMNFRNPKVITVSEALGSPVKKRISVEGTLMQVDDIADGINYKRRKIELQEGTSKISLKLWGKESEQKIPQIGSTVCVTAVNVSEYKGVKELNSSNDTLIEETGTEETFEGLVDAASYSLDDSWIMMKCGKLLSIDNENFKKVFSTNIFEEGVEVKGTRKGSKVVQIEKIEQSEESWSEAAQI